MLRLPRRNRCPQCGRPAHKVEVLCADCGHRLGAERRSSHCGKCGARLADGSDACPICGASRTQRRAVVSAPLRGRLVLALIVGIVSFVGWRLHHWELLRDRFLALGVQATVPATPTPYPTWTPRPTQAPTDVPSLTPEPTRTLVPTATSVPTVMPTATVEVLRYTVQSGDTPLGIAVQFGVELADLLKRNDLSETALLQIGQELVISGSSGGPLTADTKPVAALPTPAATPTMADPAAAAAAIGASSDAAQLVDEPEDLGQPPRLASAASAAPGVAIEPPDQGLAATPTPLATETPASTPTPSLYSHVVEQGDMLLSLSVRYDVSVEEIVEINKLSPQALLNIGQRVIIPNITNTPTLSPTPEVTETPTPTLTPTPTAPPLGTGLSYPYLEPIPLAPVNGATIEGAEQDVMLNWASVGILAEGEWYLIEVWLPCADTPLAFWTKATSLRVDAALCEAEQPDAEYRWQVQVAVRDEAGRRAAVLSPPSMRFVFLWR